MKLTLKLAGTYNLLWGVWVVLFPKHFFYLIKMEQPSPVFIWQALGMVVGVYGLGYWWASYHPLKHWPIVAVGFLGKILGPIGFLSNYLQGRVPFEFFYLNICNDLIWWLPFGYILWQVHHKTKWKIV